MALTSARTPAIAQLRTAGGSIQSRRAGRPSSAPGTVDVRKLRASCPYPRQVGADHAVLLGGSLLRRAAEAIVPLRHGNITESRGDERSDELCFQQSASDSTSPEVDVASDRVG